MLNNTAVQLAPQLLEGLKLVSTPTATAHLMGRGLNHTYLTGIRP
jgi:hypothetical protein